MSWSLLGTYKVELLVGQKQSYCLCRRNWVQTSQIQTLDCRTTLSPCDSGSSWRLSSSYLGIVVSGAAPSTRNWWGINGTQCFQFHVERNIPALGLVWNTSLVSGVFHSLGRDCKVENKLRNLFPVRRSWTWLCHPDSCSGSEKNCWQIEEKWEQGSL